MGVAAMDMVHTHSTRPGRLGGVCLPETVTAKGRNRELKTPDVVEVVVAEGFCVAVAQLATRSRRREEDRRIQDARTAAEATERQGQGLALLRGAALLSARVQLDPSELNRSRLNAFLALLAIVSRLKPQRFGHLAR